MAGTETKAPLAGDEPDRDDDQQKILGTPSKKTKAIVENEMKDQEDDESDDDEVLKLQMKLSNVSPKKPLLDDIVEAPVASLVPVPPDGGWGWVIVFASFMANLVVDGIAYAFGIIMPEFKQYYVGSDDSSVALVGSMLCGVYLLVGPVVSGLVNLFGGRSVMIAGSIIGTFGFLISYWAPSITILMVTYGIIGGIGFGLIYLPACIYVGYYFEKKRALATGIAVSGSGFGTFVFAPLTVALVDAFGSWKGAVWIFAGLILNCAVFGALMRPLPKPKALTEWIEKKEELRKVASKLSGLDANSDVSYYQQDGSGRVRRITLQTQGSQQSHVSGFQSPSLLGPEGADRAVTRARSGVSETSDSGLSPSVQPPALELVQEEPEQEAVVAEQGSTEDGSEKDKASIDKRRRSDDKSATTTTTPSPVIIEGPARKMDTFQKPRERGNSLRSNSPAPSSTATSGQDVHAASTQQGLSATQLRSGSPTAGGSRPQLNRMVSRTSRISVANYAVSMQRLTSTAGGASGSNLAAASCQSLAAIDPAEFSRPFSRQDILYPGSVQKLPQYKMSNSNLNKYRASTISIPQIVEVYESMDGQAPPVIVPVPEAGSTACEWIPAGVRHTLASMIDVKLLKSPVMVILCLSNVFGMLGFYVPFVFLTNFAESLGVSKGDSSLLLSVIGITNTVGRVAFGAVCDRGWLKALTINNFCLISCGILTLMVPFFRVYSLLMLYSVVFGFLISAYISLTAIVLVDYMGLPNLTNAFGLIILFRGLSSMAGSPLAGGVKEATNSFDACFYFAGTLIILGGVISCIVPFVDRWWRKRCGETGELNGKLMTQDIDRIDELDEIMAELAEKETASRTPSPGRSASQTLMQT